PPPAAAQPTSAPHDSAPNRTAPNQAQTQSEAPAQAPAQAQPAQDDWRARIAQAKAQTQQREEELRNSGTFSDGRPLPPDPGPDSYPEYESVPPEMRIHHPHLNRLQRRNRHRRRILHATRADLAAVGS